MVKRVTAHTVALMQALFAHNTSIIDAFALINPPSSAINWYEVAWNMIKAKSIGYDARILARVIAHLSIGTKWSRQEGTLSATGSIIGDMLRLPDYQSRESLIPALYPSTLYAKSADYAVMHYIDAICAIVDEPKKTVQFYNAIITRDTHWYVSDSIDLQLKGLLMYSEDERRLVKHTAIDNAMGSVLMYRSQLAYERALLSPYPPTTRQAIRWVWYQSNKAMLRTDTHPDITFDYVDCPFADTSMIKWRLR